METIQSIDDPRLAPYKAMRDGALLRAHQLCILEGKTVIAHALKASHFPIQSLLIAEHKLADCHALLSKTQAEIFCAPTHLLNNIVGFKFHRGVVALAKTTPPKFAPKNHGLRLALCGITNHENIGAIFRSAAALGASAIHLDQTCCDPLYRKSIRVSSGTVLSLPFQKHGEMHDMVSGLKNEGFHPLALTPHAKTALADYQPNGKTPLIVLGSEGTGLPQTIMENCEALKIPMATGVDSLNVAAASAIALYAIQAKQP